MLLVWKEREQLKVPDWHILLFVGTSLVHDYWIFWGLPRVYYWEAKKQFQLQEEDEENIA
ncbi:hypothetical protein ACFO3D_03420 [Virgibacillus kekensis]|uniref:Uncharacterized protein n=1 Tax=Virgibacillus kekensis TaxID=202261 RepID=A0ABV9DFU7_9BACI